MPDPTIRVVYNRSDIRGLGPGVQLYPCNDRRTHNDVPLATWLAYRDHPQIKGLIADESIQLPDGEPSAGDEAPKEEKRPRVRASKAEKPAEERPAEAAREVSDENAKTLATLGLT